jgi:N-acetylmuramoyl-L-alanine amidase
MDDVKNNTGYIIKGMRGPIVKELQKMLINLGYDLGSQKDDGIFGDTTKNAVETFQKDSGIKPKNDVYGIFGKITYDKIMNKSN